MDGIFDGLKEGALTMQQGGGVGYDFSTLRPSGTQARSVGTVASGPVSFMQIWDAMCGTLLSTGARRGAMMATLRCDHPDIEVFIAAKRDSQALRRFNLSVLVTDAFMEAVHGDRDWALVFPQESSPAGTESVMRPWSSVAEPIRCRVHRHVRARDLWDKLMRATYEYAEPGVLFIDRINQANNLWYREQISTTNPCGEIPLPPYGACDLGSLNLTAFVHNPFTDKSRLDLDGISKAAAFATRMMDNVIDASQFPLDKQAAQARGTRRIGLGLTGLADTLIMLGLHYAEKPARELAARVMQAICHSAYRTSIGLAEEKGTFPFFDREKYLQGKFIQSLPHDIQDGIARYGLRNSHLTAIAPTGPADDKYVSKYIDERNDPQFPFGFGLSYTTFRYGPVQLSGGSLSASELTKRLDPRAGGGKPVFTAYTAAKHAVIGMTKSLAREVGEMGITANCICPGPIRTAMTDKVPDEHKAIFANRRTALRRYGDPEEVAQMTLSLVLPAASYITGAVIPVDGGLMARNA